MSNEREHRGRGRGLASKKKTGARRQRSQAGSPSAVGRAARGRGPGREGAASSRGGGFSEPSEAEFRRARGPKKRGAKKSSRSRAQSASSAQNSADRPDGIRLQRVLAEAGIASRRKSELLIEAGEVKVNGRVVRELGTRVHPDRDRVTYRGKTIRSAQKVYFLLNKPDGVVCSATGMVDERGRPTVLSLLRGVPQRVYPVGRLDYHTRGVLIMTNDGDLAAFLTHPRSQVTKTYHVKFQGKLSAESKQRLLEGVVLEDGTKTQPAVELLPIRETATNTWIQLGIRQGLNRQIRRMGDAIGHQVLKLIRVAIGDLGAEGLSEGEFRRLSSTEVAQLRGGSMLEEL